MELKPRFPFFLKYFRKMQILDRDLNKGFTKDIIFHVVPYRAAEILCSLSRSRVIRVILMILWSSKLTHSKFWQFLSKSAVKSHFRTKTWSFNVRPLKIKIIVSVISYLILLNFRFDKVPAFLFLIIHHIPLHLESAVVFSQNIFSNLLSRIRCFTFNSKHSNFFLKVAVRW